MKNVFDFETTVSRIASLGAGTHNVRVSQATFTTDRHADLSGSKMKEIVPPWTDETPQLALTFVSTEGNGVITRRYSGLGYKTMEDLTEAEKASGKFHSKSSEKGSENYACCKNAEGMVVRVVSPDKTEKARQMISDVLGAAGIEPGRNVMDAFEEAIRDKKQLQIIVEETAYSIARKERDASAKAIFDITGVRKAGTAIAASAKAAVVADDDF